MTMTACTTSRLRPSPAVQIVSSSIEITTTVASLASPCYIEQFPSFGPLVQATCTSYQEYVTSSVAHDCGGCLTSTAIGGHGPVSTRLHAHNRHMVAMLTTFSVLNAVPGPLCLLVQRL